MDEYPIFDGECHALSKEYGYIASQVGAKKEEVQGAIDKLLQKYAEYIYENQKEKVIERLVDMMRAQVILETPSDDYQIIHRPPWIVSAIAQYGTCCIKFKRSKKDKLDDPLKSCSRCC